MYNEQSIKSMINFIQSKLDTRKNNKSINNTFTSYTNNRNMFINFTELTNLQYVHVIKVDNTFRFSEHKHIVDIGKMRKEIAGVSFQTKEMRDLIIGLADEFDNVDTFKTKKGDKLYFLCPVSISEYCPACSFIGTLKNINKVPTILQSSIYIDNDDNSMINITKLFSDINKIVDILTSGIYVMTNYHVPCVIYDESRESSSINLLQFDKKKIEFLSQSCHDMLENNGIDMMDVNIFTFKVTENEQGVFPYVTDIEFRNVDKNQERIIINDINIVKTWRKNNIEGKIFSSRSGTVTEVQNVFEGIFNRFSENLNDIIGEYASIDGLS